MGNGKRNKEQHSAHSLRLILKPKITLATPKQYTTLSIRGVSLIEILIQSCTFNNKQVFLKMRYRYHWLRYWLRALDSMVAKK